MPSKEYFQDAIKRHGVGKASDADFLMKDYQQKTKGLDQDLAKQALDGGRVWGESDQKRYDELVKKRGQAKSKAQAASGNANNSGNIDQSTQTVSPVQANKQEQNVQQDNDITTSITGDNNYVNNQQDNSIRQYGGDNRQFTYVGGKDQRTDTPASMATLGGFYDVDDSPSAQAKFTDLYSSLNKDNQKKYSTTEHIGIGAIKRAGQNSTINTNALDKRVRDREQYSRSKADMKGMNLFGDMYNYTPTDFKSPIRQTEVENT